MSKINPLVAKYGRVSRWVNWKPKKVQGRITKVPTYGPHQKMASSTDASTWHKLKGALTYSKNVGIVFTPDQNLLGIDLDKCLVNGKLSDDTLRSLVAEADTYTEVSPSGTGLHLYLALSAPLKLVANRHEHVEAYTEGRYFTTTGISYPPSRAAKEVRTITPEQALELLKITGYPWGKGPTMSFDDLEKDTSLLDPLPDTTILEGMFAASNGAAIKTLYDGDITPYKGDYSRADAALLSHLAFWTQKNSAQMDRLWLASPLGKRTKTQKRSDYRTRSVAHAISHCSEVYTPSEHSPDTSTTPVDDPSLDLMYTTKGKEKTYYKNTENISRIIGRHPLFANTFRFDAYRVLIERKVDDTFRALEDWDAVDVQTKISTLFSDFANVRKDMVYDAIIKVAYDNTVDTGADYLRNLKWDNVPRLDSWLSSTCHTPDNTYHRSIGANWLKGLVRRVIQPGCKFDYVLVLEGPQGIGKSTLLLTLAGALGHVETTMSTEQKDFFMQFLGNAIVEFSEGETLSRTEVKRMKALITVQVDKFRAPYGRNVVPHPRRSVFAMTTNQTEYLKDETGNRRWLPVAVIGQVDIEWMEKNREQIFAEAYYRVVSLKETTWEFPQEELMEQQSLRRIQDANSDAIGNWYLQLSKTKRDEGITVDQAHRDALHNGFSSPMTKLIEMGISDVLRNTLCLDKRRGLIGGLRCTRWYPTEKTPDVVDVPTSVSVDAF